MKYAEIILPLPLEKRNKG